MRGSGYGWGNRIQHGHLLREYSGDFGDLLAAEILVRTKLRILLGHSGSAVAKEIADFKEGEVPPGGAVPEGVPHGVWGKSG